LDIHSITAPDHLSTVLPEAEKKKSPPTSLEKQVSALVANLREIERAARDLADEIEQNNQIPDRSLRAFGKHGKIEHFREDYCLRIVIKNMVPTGQPAR
jgi:hypothetical protein